MTDWMYSVTLFQMRRKILRCVENVEKNALVKCHAIAQFKGMTPLIEAISIFHLLIEHQHSPLHK
jgi:hypothetical protein